MSSKKNKKSKGVTMSLSEFTARVEEGTGAPTPGSGQNVVYAERKPKMPVMSSWADEVDEDASFFEKERIILPSAPRAARGPAYDDREIPQNPPFTAHLGNLPYDISDEEIYKFFRDLEIADLKLPRDQQTNRLRGFGYVDFETRADLIEALIRNEQMMRGRPIRITLGTGQQNRGHDMDRGGMRGGEDRRRPRPPAEDDDVDDWRSVMKPQGFDEPQEFRRGPPSGDYGSMPRGERGGYNRDRERNYGQSRGPPREEEVEFSRSQMMAPPPPQQRGDYGGYSRGGPRGGYQQNRGGDREYYDRGGQQDYNDHYYNRGGGPPSHYQSSSRHHSESSEDAGTASTWRRPQTASQSSQNYGPPSHSPPPSHHYQPPHHQRSESPPMRRASSPDYGPSRREREREDSSEPHDSHDPPQSQPPKERKRLVLQPRTVDKPVGEADPASASIFGGAKPVDTQKREREIEEKLEKLKVEETPPKPAQGEREGDDDDDEDDDERGESPSADDSSAPPQRQRSDRDLGGRGSDRDLGGRGSDRDLGGRGSDRDLGGRGSDRDLGGRGSDRDLGGRGSDRDLGGRGGDRDFGSRGGDRDGGRGGDRDRGQDRPKQFRLLTRNNSGSNGKDAYIDVEAPYEAIKGSASASSSSMPNSRSHQIGRPPLPPQGYSNSRFMRSDDKDRGGDRGPYRGGRTGGGPSGRRDLDGGSRGGRGGDFRRGGSRDLEGGGGRGRSFGDGPGPQRRGGYDRRDDDQHSRGGGFRGERDDFRRGPPHHTQHSHHNNNQSSSIGSQEERDRDSHSEPEDDRDMIRGGGEKGGDYSDDSGDFTRVEHRRGRKSYNRMSSNTSTSASAAPASNPNNNKPPPRDRVFYQN